MAARKTTKKAAEVVEKAKTIATEAVETVEKEVKSVTKTKKAPAKKAAPVVKAKAFVEFYGKTIAVADIKEKAIEAFKASNEGVEITDIELYIKPEENAAYYVINGEGSADFRIEL